MNTEFYETLDLKYPEYGVIMEDCIAGGDAKVYIPILMPELSNSTISDISYPRESVSNIINKNGREGITGYTTSNYVTIKSPEYIGNLSKNDKVIIVFVGGSINNPRIIGKE